MFRRSTKKQKQNAKDLCLSPIISVSEFRSEQIQNISSELEFYLRTCCCQSPPRHRIEQIKIPENAINSLANMKRRKVSGAYNLSSGIDVKDTRTASSRRHRTTSHFNATQSTMCSHERNAICKYQIITMKTIKRATDSDSLTLWARAGGGEAATQQFTSLF